MKHKPGTYTGNTPNPQGFITAPKRKIIQIQSEGEVLYCLCDDGSVWWRGVRGGLEEKFKKWNPLPNEWNEDEKKA